MDKVEREIEKRDRWPDGYRWALVENFRKRSDESANLLRALLVLIAGSSAAFLLEEHYDKLPNLHGLSILFFGLAIATTVWSWDRQKSKSIERLKALRDKGYAEYESLEQFLSIELRNSTIDALTYFLLASGFLTEVILVFAQPTG